MPQVFLRFGPPIARIITDTLSARGLQGGTAALATVPVALQSFDPATLSRFRGFTSRPLVQPLGQPSAQPTLAALLMSAPLPQSSFSSRAAAASDNGTEVVAARLRLRRNAAVDAVFIERPQHAASLWTELSQTQQSADGVAVTAWLLAATCLLRRLLLCPQNEARFTGFPSL